jgi:uncharacterized protein involved in exopolysaccharide biosynthesis
VAGGLADHLQHGDRRGRRQLILRRVLATERNDNPHREPLVVHATVVSNPEPGDSIDLGIVWAFLNRHLRLFLLLGLLFSAVAYVLSHFATRWYRAELTLEPVSQEDVASGLSGLTSRIGGMAGLLGIDLGKSSSSTAASLATIKSRLLLADFIERNNLLPLLYPNRWDAGKKQWTVPPDKVPTTEDGYQMFIKEILATREDKKGGLIILSVDWRDPRLAAQWANGIVAEANRYIAERAAVEAQRNVDFLNAEVVKSEDVGLRQAIYMLVESEVKKRMLARTRVDYAFRVLDPAVPPQLKRYVRPQRILYALGGALVGCLFAGLLALWRDRRPRAAPGVGS